MAVTAITTTTNFCLLNCLISFLSLFLSPPVLLLTRSVSFSLRFVFFSSHRLFCLLCVSVFVYSCCCFCFCNISSSSSSMCPGECLSALARSTAASPLSSSALSISISSSSSSAAAAAPPSFPPSLDRVARQTEKFLFYHQVCFPLISKL